MYLEIDRLFKLLPVLPSSKDASSATDGVIVIVGVTSKLLDKINTRRVLKELLCTFNACSVGIIYSMSIKPITDRNFEIFPTSRYLSFASGIKSSLGCLNLLCESSVHCSPRINCR